MYRNLSCSLGSCITNYVSLNKPLFRNASSYTVCILGVMQTYPAGIQRFQHSAKIESDLSRVQWWKWCFLRRSWSSEPASALSCAPLIAAARGAARQEHMGAECAHVGPYGPLADNKGALIISKGGRESLALLGLRRPASRLLYRAIRFFARPVNHFNPLRYRPAMPFRNRKK